MGDGPMPDEVEGWSTSKILQSSIFTLKGSSNLWSSLAYLKITILSKDFEDFDLANEDDVLEEFLGIERENPKVKK